MTLSKKNPPGARLPDCLEPVPYTPEACERETVRGMNRVAPKCSKGHPTSYSHGVGAFRCEFGALVRASGVELRPCA